MLKYPRKYASFSSLRLFEACPFSYHMRYVAGIKAPQPPKAKLGSLFQDALNSRYSGSGDPMEHINKMPPKQRTIATPLLEKATPFENIEALDEPYDVDLGFDVPFRIVPDILTKTEIVENKYTGGYYNPASVKKEQQALLYYVGIRKLFGDRKVYYQLFNNVEGTVTMVEIDPNGKQIDGLFDWMEVQFKGIDKCMKTDIWDTGKHRQCDFKITCPLMEKYGV